MNRSFFLVAAAALLGVSAQAQTSFPEIEPNSNKTEATPVTGIVSGDTINGLTTGSTTTAGSTVDASLDTYRIKTGALPFGVYKHTLTLTTSTAPGHIGSIRGLQQTGTPGVGGVVGTLDLVIQSSTSLTPTRFNCWYGFGKQEEFYYRVTGTATTTSSYQSTLNTTTIAPTAIAGTYLTGPVTITTIGQTTANTDICLFDANYDAIPGASNNDEGPILGSTQSRLTRCLAPGTYLLCVAGTNLTTNYPAPADERFFSDTVLDFPGAAVYSSSVSTGQDWDFVITDGVTTTPVTNQVPVGTPYEATWFTFSVAGAAAPLNDVCANATVIAPGIHTGDLSLATNDGLASCDTGGASSKDVWYSYTNGAAPMNLSLDTCATTGVDTVITVYSACGGSELACSDNCGGFPCAGVTSCLTTPLSASQSVLIRVSDRGLGGGCFSLNVAAVPTNDECTAPIALPGRGVYAFDSTAAITGTQGQAAAAPCASGPKKDVWYTYTATTTGTLTVSTCSQTTSTNRDTKVALYGGSGCPAAAALACNDNAGSTACAPPSGFGNESIVSAPVTCGDVITIQVGGVSTVSGIVGTFTVTEVGTTCSTPTTSFCLGDGTGAACPCANTGATGHGCASMAFAGGGILSSSGIAGASIGTDSLVLTATDIPGPGLFFQSSGLSGTPINFGDGHLCASVGIVRLGVVFPAVSSASYPGGLTPNPIHIAGGTASGDTRHYQCWYRTLPGLCNPSNFNLTQGLTLTWGP